MNLSERVHTRMQVNNNCALTMMGAVAEELGVPISKEVEATTTLFRGGLGSGCVCGALAGSICLSGYLDSLYPHPLKEKLAPHLHDLFRQTFGATCCRAIRAKRPLHLRLSHKPCQELTARFAVLVYELWAPVLKK